MHTITHRSLKPITHTPPGGVWASLARRRFSALPQSIPTTPPFPVLLFSEIPQMQTLPTPAAISRVLRHANKHEYLFGNATQQTKNTPTLLLGGEGNTSTSAGTTTGLFRSTTNNPNEPIWIEHEHPATATSEYYGRKNLQQHTNGRNEPLYPQT